MECPVCWESVCADGDGSVACAECKHIVCGECEEGMKKAAVRNAAVLRCPMCRTPRAPTRRTLPVQALVHAFHCQDPSCQITTCANTKRVLGRMEAHVQGCRQEVGGTDECKVCKLWQALHRTRGNGNQDARGEGGGAGGGGGVRINAVRRLRPRVVLPEDRREEVGARVRVIDPAQVKRMLLAHVRSCRNRRCQTCRKLRERIRQRRVDVAEAGLLA